MFAVYAGEKAPGSFSQSIFLAGPTPRRPEVRSWRPEALRFLREFGYEGVVFVPEYREDGVRVVYSDYVTQVEWEEKHLNMSDCILFWIPRDMKTMPGLTTNDEWGVWKDSGKVVFGTPPNAEKVNYQRYYAEKLKIPYADALSLTVSLALLMVGKSALRQGGEREVPLLIWNTAHFQEWYKAHKNAGNHLDGAKVVWTFRVGAQKTFPFLWAIHANVYIANEKRNKINEVVIARPSISTIVMYRRDRVLLKSDIVLIREFRSPVSNGDCYVWEVPGGSSKKAEDPIKLAADECKEETSLVVDPSRMHDNEARQMVSTLSTHKAHLYSVEITKEELSYLKSQTGIAHGILADTERTYVEIKKLSEILAETNVDWSMLGMILSVLIKK